MAPLRTLFVFTSGTFRSANNKKWFHLFQNHPDAEITILIKQCSAEELSGFEKNFGSRYKIIFFPAQEELLKLPWLKRLGIIRSVAGSIDEFSPQIIHIHGLFYTYLIYPLMLIRSKAKIIYNVWGDDFNSSYRKRIKNRYLVRWLIRKAALIWANWYALGDMLKAEFPQAISKIRTIPLGIDEDLFQPASEQHILSVREKFKIAGGEYIMLYARGFYENANQHRLIQALAHLPADLNFKLILQHSVANETYENRLTELIKKHDLQEKVVLSHEYLSDGEMKALFQIANLSFSLTINEQLSRTVFESILSDTHIIFHDIEPYRYLKNNFGFQIDLIRPGDEQVLARRIFYYITEKPQCDWRYEKLLINRLFRFETKADTFLSIYKSLLNY